jgi:predicted nucleotide-binding protein
MMKKMAENQSADIPKRTAEVFISYSHQDENWRRRLQQHLDPLKRQGVVFWDDSEIHAGSYWTREIERRLEESQVVLLLISPSFVSSEFHRAECRRALDRHNAGDAFVIPLITSPVDWKVLPIHGLKAIPEGGKAVSLWRDPEDALEQVPGAIKRALARLPDRRRQRAVLIMPFGAARDEIRETVREALKETGFEVMTWEEAASTSISSNFADAIESSDLIIADLTEGSPNVMYELGYAHALRKPTILLRNEKDTAGIPADLAGYIYLVYSPSNLGALRAALSRAIAPHVKAA